VCLSGHSLGALEVNYVIAHTNRFIAAIAQSGISNVTSSYNDLWGNNLPGGIGGSMQSYIGGQLGAALEKDLNVFIKNSPVFFAHNIKTPLLIMHNMNDLNVPFYQSSQLFVQLRSLNKKVWLISYENEAHMLSKVENQVTHQKIVKSYLDHFLKDAPMPFWMNNPISYETNY
jgi:dipeptidyl aminopeptidase/acylaminoacyl peptidase